MSEAASSPHRVDLFGWIGTAWRKISADLITRALIIIDYAHHEIHGGSAYYVTDVQSVDTTSMYWVITTPNTTKWGHYVLDLEATGEVEVEVFEGGDRVPTTALIGRNANRNEADSPGVTHHRAYSAGTTDGISIFCRRSGATGVGGKTVAGGGARSLNEKILKQNTQYIVKATTFDTIHVTFGSEWYEHTNKD